MSTPNRGRFDQSVLELHRKVFTKLISNKGRLRRFWDCQPEFAVSYIKELTNDTIRELLSSIVTGVVNENHLEELEVFNIKEDLKRRKVVASFPMEILHILLTEVVKEESISVVRKEVRHKVKLQYDMLICDLLINEYLDKDIEYLVKHILEEMSLDMCTELLIKDVIRETLSQVASDSITELDKIEKQKALSKFDKSFGQRIVNQLSCHILLSTMASITDPLASNSIVQQPFYVLGGVLSWKSFLELNMDILLNQYFLMEDNAKATTENDPIRRLHKNLFIDSAMDVLLKELAGHLDEDRQDLNEHEMEFM